MDYSSCLEYLYGLQHFGIKLGLENTRLLLERLGNPQRSLRIVHIAGTNGKGSTAAALEQLLRSAGHRTGLYTSPHLHSFTERIRINGQMIEAAEVVAWTNSIRDCSQGLKPTFFEFTTVMALCAFAREKVDWVILETGLGGRLDSTNVVDPELCIITPIALDHAAHLGGSLKQIAAEKGGIIKPGVPLVCARQDPDALAVLQQLAKQHKAPLVLAGLDFSWRLSPEPFNYTGLNLSLSHIEAGLSGSYQRDNISLALAAVERLLVDPIDSGVAISALAELRWPGRLETCGELLLDGAHNPHAANALAAFLAEEQLSDLLWVAAIKADKDVSGIMAPLMAHVEKVFAAPLEGEETKLPGELVDIANRFGVAGEMFTSSAAALQRALEVKRPGQKILVAGSLFLVAALRGRCLELSGVRV